MAQQGRIKKQLRRLQLGQLRTIKNAKAWIVITQEETKWLKKQMYDYRFDTPLTHTIT